MLSLSFAVLRPQSHFGTKKGQRYLKQSSPRHAVVKPDLTKLIRATEDALKGIVWRDDSQVVYQATDKHYDDWQGVKVSVCPLQSLQSVHKPEPSNETH